MLEPTIKGKEKAWKFGFPEMMMSNHAIQLLLFRNDRNQRIKIVKIEDVNLEKLIQHLNKGESILITSKHINKEKPAFNEDKEVSKPWYFTHI